MYARSVSFEWDPEKAAVNARKHGVRFAEAVGVFDDDYAITIRDNTSTGEERFVTIGEGIKGAVLVVVYCYRVDDIRIISARRATKPEREQYEAHNR